MLEGEIKTFSTHEDVLHALSVYTDTDTDRDRDDVIYLSPDFVHKKRTPNEKLKYKILRVSSGEKRGLNESQPDELFYLPYERFLSEGSFGNVYQAYPLFKIHGVYFFRPNNPIAVKKMKEKNYENLTGEEISRLFCVDGECRKRHYYQIMKYYPADLFFYFGAEAFVDQEGAEGFIEKNNWNGSAEAFHQLGRTFKALDFIQRINLVLKILRSLQKIHNKRIIHRDIKPENILCRIEPNVSGDLNIDVMIMLPPEIRTTEIDIKRR